MINDERVETPQKAVEPSVSVKELAKRFSSPSTLRKSKDTAVAYSLQEGMALSLREEKEQDLKKRRETQQHNQSFRGGLGKFDEGCLLHQENEKRDRVARSEAVALLNRRLTQVDHQSSQDSQDSQGAEYDVPRGEEEGDVAREAEEKNKLKSENVIKEEEVLKSGDSGRQWKMWSVVVLVALVWLGSTKKLRVVKRGA